MRQFLTFLIFIALLSPVFGQEPAIDNTYLKSIINDIKETAGLPSGTAIAVVKGQNIVYQGYFGLRDISNKLPVEPSTQFYIASTTKPFTALNVLLDANSKHIDLDTTLATMFPSMSLESRRDVTIQDLMVHTASINNLPLVLATAYSGEHNGTSLNAMVRELSVPSSEAVGDFKYTNVGYNIYSVYSDTHFDETWQSRLKKQVFRPAGMTSTSSRRSSLREDSQIAKPYSLMTRIGRQQALYLEKTDDTMHAAGGMFSTATDLGRFVIAQLNQGRIDGKQVFPADVISQSHQQQATTEKSYLDFDRDGYAWGWYTGKYKSQRMLHHFGGFAGAHAHISFIPEKSLGLVVINNEDFLSSRLTSIIADYIYGALLGDSTTQSRIDTRVSALKSRLSGLDSMLTKEQQKLVSRKWLLSKPESAYVGRYTHELLGEIVVSLNDEMRFDVSWGAMRSSSLGMDTPDQIRVELEPNTGTVITFEVGDHVTSLHYAGIVFKKVTH